MLSVLILGQQKITQLEILAKRPTMVSSDSFDLDVSFFV